MVPPTIPTFPQFLAASALCILPSPPTMSDQDRFLKSEGVLRSLEKKPIHRKALRIEAEKRWLCWSLLPTPPSAVLVCDKMTSAASLGPPALLSFEMTTAVFGWESNRRALLPFLWDHVDHPGPIDSVGLSTPESKKPFLNLLPFKQNFRLSFL